ncbi:MAG: hypothetical protein KF715_04415 [Candidatus Didemnitutus sp.]|nr:hypothetical protein [Candidatus Didemnitutus sp.]
MLAAKVALCAKALTIASADAEWFDRLQLYYGLTTVIAAVTGFLLAASFALDDELVGTRMFWATRPISGLRLLAAKSIGLALFFVAVPVLVWVPWWLYCGCGAWELFKGAAEVGIAHGLATLMALLVSALTGKSSRFLLLLLSVLLLSLLAGILAAGRTFARPLVSPDVLLAREILVLLLCGSGVLGAIWLQYRMRRTAWSTALVVAWVGLGIWAFKAWPLAFTQSWRGETWSDAGLESVDARWVSLVRSTTNDRVQVAPGYARFELKFQVRNVPETVRLSSGQARVSLFWPDGKKIVQDPRLRTAEPTWIARSKLGVGADIRETDTETKAFTEMRISEFRAKRGFNEKPRAPDGAPYIELTGDIYLPLELANRLGGEVPKSNADVRLDFRRPALHLETPLVVGAEAAGDGARVCVLADITPPKDKNPHAERSYSVAHYEAARDNWLNVVFQRGTGAMNVRTSRSRSGNSPFGLLAPFAWETLSLQVPRVRRGDVWVPAPGADEVPTLVVASYEGITRAQRQCVLTNEPPSR